MSESTDVKSSSRPEFPAVVVHGDTSTLTQTITSGIHHLIGDEPVELGGSDQGPNPYDFLLMALGT